MWVRIPPGAPDRSYQAEPDATTVRGSVWLLGVITVFVCYQRANSASWRPVSARAEVSEEKRERMSMAECRYGQPTWTSPQPHMWTATLRTAQASLITAAVISVRASGIGR